MGVAVSVGVSLEAPVAEIPLNLDHSRHVLTSKHALTSKLVAPQNFNKNSSLEPILHLQVSVYQQMQGPQEASQSSSQIPRCSQWMGKTAACCDKDFEPIGMHSGACRGCGLAPHDCRAAP